MNTIKQVFLILLSLFLLYFSFSMVRKIVVFGPEQLGFGESFFLAFLINLCVTGIFAFPSFVMPISRLMPQGYYAIKNSSNVMCWYRVLWIKHFQKLLILFFWGKNASRKKFFEGERKAGINLSSNPDKLSLVT